MTKINITRSQVAQLYVELTNDNLKETFIVEGDAIQTELVPEVAPTPEVPADAPVEASETKDEVAPTE